MRWMGLDAAAADVVGRESGPLPTDALQPPTPSRPHHWYSTTPLSHNFAIARRQRLGNVSAGGRVSKCFGSKLIGGNLLGPFSREISWRQGTAMCSVPLLRKKQLNSSSGSGGSSEKWGMSSEAARRASFALWPHMHYRWALPAAMAEAGFFHVANQAGDDRVNCFACTVCLVCWEPADEPWSAKITA